MELKEPWGSGWREDLTCLMSSCNWFGFSRAGLSKIQACLLQQVAEAIIWGIKYRGGAQGLCIPWLWLRNFDRILFPDFKSVAAINMEKTRNNTRVWQIDKNNLSTNSTKRQKFQRLSLSFGLMLRNQYLRKCLFWYYKMKMYEVCDVKTLLNTKVFPKIAYL